MKKTLLSVLILVTIQSVSLAQHTWSIDFNTVMPLGDLRNDSPALFGAGVNLEMAFQLKQSPIYLGASTSLNIYGSERQDLVLPMEMGDQDVTRRNYLANVLGFARYKPQNMGRIRPYVDLSVGYSFIFTQAEFHHEQNGDCWTEFEGIIDDGSFTYGIGGGIEYNIAPTWSLDLSVRTLRGGTVNYLTPSSLEYVQAVDTYNMDLRSSRLEYMMVNLGVNIQLDF